MSSEIILFDLPSKGSNPHCWSPNPWKARAALNFKGISYKTEWTEYPDLAPRGKELGIPPNDRSTSYADYSSPFVKLSNGTYVMDSRKIAETLDQIQPQPSLHTDKGDTIDRVQGAVATTLLSFVPILMPRVPEMLLNARSAEYFHETRAKRFGMPLPELEKSEKGGEAAWTSAEEGMRQLEAILKENQDGPYVMGKEPSFSDLVLGGFWMFWKNLDKNGDLFDRGMKFSPAFSEHYKAVEKWFERDD